MASNSECLISNSKQCTPSTMLNIAKYIGKDWKCLGRQLDVEEAMLEDIEDKYRTYGFQEMAYQVMVIWQQIQGKDATISALEEQLSAIGRTDIRANRFHIATSTASNNTSTQSSYEYNTTSHIDKVQFLKDIQERLRCQYKDLEMKGLPWMEDLLLTLDDYYVDLTMSKLDRRGRVLPSAEIKIEDILNANNDEKPPTRVLVEGGPGHGKSTLAAKLAYDWAKEASYLHHYDLVLLLPLRHFVEDFEETVRKTTFVKSKDKEQLIEILNDRSKMFLFILDGYDEASPKTEKSVLAILQKDIFSHVTVVVTSRPGKFPSKPGTCQLYRTNETTELYESTDIAPTFSYFIDRRVYIQGFTLEQQAMFMKKHLKSYSEQQKANINSKLAEVIDKEFLKCPLFLLMLIVVFTNDTEDDKSFETKTDLYKHVFNCVIKRYFSKLGVQSYSDVDICSSESWIHKTPHYLITQFSQFALWAITTECLSFSREDILKVNACDARILDLGFLTQNVHVKGLRERLVYEPVHKSLLEFAAAFAIWLMFTADGLDHWKEKAISLRPTLQNYQSKQLCFPFLAGLMGSQVMNLFNVLIPFAKEYSSDFGILGLCLLETQITYESLTSLKPFIPEKWLVPWLKNDDGFSVSRQHEAVVRFGSAEGVIKLINWDLCHPALFPSDVKLEILMCGLGSNTTHYNPLSFQNKQIRCKDLWINFPSLYTRGIEQTIFQARELLNFQRISYSFCVTPEWFPAIKKTLVMKDTPIHWFKTNGVLDNKDCKLFLSMVIELIKNQRVKRIALVVDSKCPQKHIDSLVKCAGKSCNLESFILQSSPSTSEFFVDLAQLCDGGKKTWNWLHLTKIRLKCRQLIKGVMNIKHLDLGSSDVKLSLQEKLQNCLSSTLALPSSLLSHASGIWNLGILHELDIVLQTHFLDMSLPIIVTKCQNLKVLGLTMTTFEYKLGTVSVLDWFHKSRFVSCLQRLEIWKINANPLLARDIVEGVSDFLERNMQEPLNDQKGKLSLQSFLLNMSITYYKAGLDVTSSHMKHGEMFLPAVLRLKQCLSENVLPQLEIVRCVRVHANSQPNTNSWMTLFPEDEGFRLQCDLWGAKQDDSMGSKEMHERNPGLIQRLSIAYARSNEAINL